MQATVRRFCRAVPFDGKLMAFPGNQHFGRSESSMGCGRTGWKKLGLSVPETIDDVKHIALTFAEENPANQEMSNIGLAVSTTLYGGTGISSEYGMNLILPHLVHIREDG